MYVCFFECECAQHCTILSKNLCLVFRSIKSHNSFQTWRELKVSLIGLQYSRNGYIHTYCVKRFPGIHQDGVALLLVEEASITQTPPCCWSRRLKVRTGFFLARAYSESSHDTLPVISTERNVVCWGREVRICSTIEATLSMDYLVCEDNESWSCQLISSLVWEP